MSRAKSSCCFSGALLVAAISTLGNPAEVHGWAGLSSAVQESKPVVDEGPAEYFGRGKKALEDGDLATAEKDFRQVVALDRSSTAAFINLGVVYLREKRWREAITELKHAEMLAPDDPGISLNIGLAYYRQNHFSSAIGPFTKVLQRAPDSLQARYLLGLCYFFTDAYADAAKTLVPLWDRQSQNLNYLYVLSIAATKSKDSALEERSFNQMLKVGESKPEFHLYVGKAWLAEGNTEQAIHEFRAAAAATPDLPFVHYFLGRAYLQQRDYVEAEKEFREDLSREPDLPYSYLDLGLLSVQLHQSERAAEYFRQAIARDGTIVDAYIGLAKLDREKADDEEALRMLDRAVQLSPNSASVHYLRGQVLSRLGQTVAAKEEFARSASLLKSLNDRLQKDPSGDLAADAETAAQQ